MSIPEELKHLNWVWLDDRDHPTTIGALTPPTPPDVRYEFMPDCHPIVPEEDYPESVAQLLDRFEDGRALTMAALLGIQILNPYITAEMNEAQQAQYYRVIEIAYKFLDQEPENWEFLEEEMREALQDLMTSMWHTSTPWTIRDLARAPASLIEDYGFYYSGDWSFELLRDVTDEYICRIVPQRTAFDLPTPEFIRRWWELIVCTFPIREGVDVQLD